MLITEGKIGRKLASMKVERGLTQKELAEMCGHDRSYIGMIERAEKSATVNMIYKLAKGLRIDAKDFFL